MTIEQGILFAVIVMLAACIEGIVGFGGNILALPFITLFLDLELAVPILMLVPMLNASFRIVSEYKNIFWPAFWKIVLMGVIGGYCGIFMADYLSETVLKLCLSIFMIAVAGKGLYELQIGKTIVLETEKQSSIFTKLIHAILLFLSGIYNGAFACGGPFVAIYATSVLKEKKHFRATMYATVLLTMGVMIAQKIASGVYTGEVLVTSCMLLPALVIGYLISSNLQKKITGNLFLKFVYVVLLLAGCSMLIVSVAKVL